MIILMKKSYYIGPIPGLHIFITDDKPQRFFKKTAATFLSSAAFRRNLEALAAKRCGAW